MLPKVFLTRLLPPEAMNLLQKSVDLTYNAEDRVLSKAEIIAGLRGKEGLLCLLTDPIDAEIMDASADLKIIANYAVGFNNIDLQAARDRNIMVTNTPGVLTESTAELTMSLLLAVARRVVEGDAYLRSGNWTGWGPLQLLGKEVFGSTLGIIGMGRIGKAVARRAVAFGMKLCYWNRHRLAPEEEQSEGWIFMEREELLRQSDFVSLHLAYTEETHHLIGAEELQMMREGSFLINTARGAIIDETALVKALESRYLGGAALDVYEKEPQVHPGLIWKSNVVLLPHLGSATLRTRSAMGLLAAKNLVAALNGERPENLVE